jgi:hypothetical protein
MSNYNPQGGGLQYRGTAAQSPPNCFFSANDPTIYDTQGFSLLDFWLNTLTTKVFVLTALTGNSLARRSIAQWTPLSSGSSMGNLSTVTGNDGVHVPGDVTGNINIIGTGPISVTGNAATFTATIAIAPATNVTYGSALYSTNADTIGGINTGTAVTPASLSAKLGTQTLDGLAYGAGGTGTALLWTALGASGTVLTGTGSAPAFSAHPSLTQVTITGSVTNPTDTATKAYVDGISAGFSFQAACVVATTANLTATYNNGAAGVGATLTNSGVQATLTIDGVMPTVSSRILVKNQSTQANNGIYTVTNVGSGATNWVLTRATDYDVAGTQIKPGNIVPISMGTVNANTLWLQTATVATVGTDPIIFVPFGITPVIPLPIADGGTNTTSFSNTNGTVYFDGTELATVNPGTSGQVLTSNGAGSAPTFQTVSPGGTGITITTYNTPGSFTWTKAVSTKLVTVIGWGAGSGGGSGGTGTHGGGGAGGGAGGCFYYTLPASFIGSTTTVIVGTGGSGATGVSAANTIGTTGGSGGYSSFGNIATQSSTAGRGGGGGGAPNGQAIGGVCGCVANPGNYFLSSLNTNSVAGPAGAGGGSGAGVFAVGSAGPSINVGSLLPTGGGGGGGGTSGGGGAFAGGPGGSINNLGSAATILAGGTSPSGVGNDGSTAVDFMSGGTGGGGGSFGSLAGGNGGFPGGGGGGGAGIFSGTSGAGGAGGNGLVIVVEYA